MNRSGQVKHLAGMDIGYYVSDLANKSMSGIYVKHVIYPHQRNASVRVHTPISNGDMVTSNRVIYVVLVPKVDSIQFSPSGVAVINVVPLHATKKSSTLVHALYFIIRDYIVQPSRTYFT